MPKIYGRDVIDRIIELNAIGNNSKQIALDVHLDRKTVKDILKN